MKKQVDASSYTTSRDTTCSDPLSLRETGFRNDPMTVAPLDELPLGAPQEFAAPLNAITPSPP